MEQDRLKSLSNNKRKLLELLSKKQKLKQYKAFSLLNECDRNIMPEGVVDAYPLGMVQLGMMFHMQNVPISTSPPDYHNVASFILKLNRPFSKNIFQESVNAVVEKHPCLRTKFDLSNFSTALQLVKKSAELTVGYIDLREVSQQQQEKELEDFIEKENIDLMDMSKAPLMRLSIHHFKDDVVSLSLTEPHSVADGWSTHLTIIDIFNLYFAVQEGQPFTLPDIKTSYAEFIDAELKVLRSDKAINFWSKRLEACIETNLPQKSQEKSVASAPLCDHRPSLEITESIVNGLFKIAKLASVPVKSVLCAAHLRLLSLLSGQNRVTTGLNFNGRLETIDGTQVRGMFLNMLPVTLELSGGSWIELVKKAFEAETEILPYRRFPLAQLQNMNCNKPLFNTAFSFLHFHSLAENGGLEGEKLVCLKAIDHSKTNFDFNSVFSLDAYGKMQMEYLGDVNVDRFSAQQINSFMQSYLMILEDLVAFPERNYNRLNFLAQDDLKMISDNFNLAVAGIQKFVPVHKKIMLQGKKYSLTNALKNKQDSVSYEQLNLKANYVALALNKRGVGKGDLVAVHMRRSFDSVIAILGILKSGAGFVPLEQNHPVARLRNIIVESKAALVLIDQGAPNKLAGNTLSLSEALAEAASISSLGLQDIQVSVMPQDTAYVLYTSGSTGKPKGVIVTHGSLSAYLDWASRVYLEGKTCCMPLFTSYAFDLTLTSLFLPLVSGGSVYIFDEEPTVRLLEYIVNEVSLNTIKLTPAHLALMEKLNLNHSPIQRIIVGGEQLHVELAKKIQKQMPDCVEIYNEYGPTEATIGCMIHKFEADEDIGHVVPIGKPAEHVKIYLLDSNLNQVPFCVKGEIYIAGECLAKGYLNDLEMTNQKFIDNPFDGGKMYRSGDLARRLTGNLLEFLGRTDEQVKIRGYRIEVGEVEAQLDSEPMVKQSVVLSQIFKDEAQLVAYIVPENQFLLETQEKNKEAPFKILENKLKARLEGSLPVYMQPNIYVFKEQLLLTSNGKVNKKKLQIPENYELTTNEYVVPENDVQEKLCQLIEKVLQKTVVGIDDNLFKIGATSISCLTIMSDIRKVFDTNISVADLYTHSTVRELSELIELGHNSTVGENTNKTDIDDELNLKTSPYRHSSIEHESFAIVGMAGRFPDANSVDSFWNNILNGVETITTFSRFDLLNAGVEASVLNKPNYVPKGVLLDNIRTFDADFFNFTPREAQMMDPQQRLLYECVQEVFEDAGYADFSHQQNVGVYVGVGESYYLFDHILPDENLLKLLGPAVLFNNCKDFPATRISYKFNLNGPSVNVGAACSTSLLAVHQACNSLLLGECDMALAGGARVGNMAANGYVYEEGGILSPDGRCLPFSAEANGTRSGDGAGVVLIKRLSDALAAKDCIYAVIKGTAANNDGSDKVGYTAPCSSGQAQVIKRALYNSQVEPDSIQFIECHGTGTKIGDPIEISALNKSYATNKRNVCALGSVKFNIGHLDAAAGIASLIKTSKVLQTGILPPNPGFEQVNPEIDFKVGPFYVNNTARGWPNDTKPRRAAVSSFGIGGTNCHVIMQEAPAETLKEDNNDYPYPECGDQLFVLSARTEEALVRKHDDLHHFMTQSNTPSLSDVAYTLQCGRQEMEYRNAIIANEESELLNNLDLTKYPLNFKKVNRSTDTIFMFTGQGAQYSQMAAGLYREVPEFTAQFDECNRLFQQASSIDLCELLFGVDDKQKSQALDSTATLQPALFAVEYSLAKTLMQWGISPKAMIGHSLGEIVAACLADVFSLEDAVKLVTARGRLMQETASGAMLSVSINEQTLTGLSLCKGYDVAAVNSTEDIVLSGTQEKINILKQNFTSQGIDFRELNSNRAFHSNLMEPILNRFQEVLNSVTFHSPRIPFVSNVTGCLHSANDEDWQSYWVKHMRSSVLFHKGIETLKNKFGKELVWIEFGPGKSLVSYVQKLKGIEPGRAINLLRHSMEDKNDRYQLLQSIGKLWMKGVSLNWKEFVSQSSGRKTRLPTYPFIRKEHWFERIQFDKIPEIDKKSHELNLYVPVWTLNPLARFKQEDEHLQIQPEERAFNLIFIDSKGLGDKISELLKAQNKEVIEVRIGKSYRQANEVEFELQADKPEQIRALIQHVKEKQFNISRIIYLWSMDAQIPILDELEAVIYPVNMFLSLVQSIRLVGLKECLALEVITNESHRVTGLERIYPEQTALGGVIKVIGQEYPEIECYQTDIDLVLEGKDIDSSSISSETSKIAETLITALKRKQRDKISAYRSGQLWTQQLLPIQDGTEKPLSLNGVVVICGGLGNMGIALADYFCNQLKYQVVLIGHSGFPSKTKWPEILKGASQTDKNDPDFHISEKIVKLMKLNEGLKRAHIFQADITNYNEMLQSFMQVQEQIGEITCVIHAAVDSTSIEMPLIEVDKHVLNKQFAIKAQGLKVLDQLKQELGFQTCIAMSSLSSVLGGLGFSAYASANAYMDAFIQKKHQQGDAGWQSINWDGWDFEADLRQDRLSVQTEKSTSISIDAGLNLLDRILRNAQQYPQVVTSVGHIQPRIDKWLNGIKVKALSGEVDTTKFKENECKLNDTEKRVLSVWKQMLGIKKLSADSNFFDIGGDSLLASRIIAAIRDDFKLSDRQLTIKDFFDYPSVSMIAKKINSTKELILAQETESSKFEQLQKPGFEYEEGVF